MYDIIGDIHGEAEKLQLLLARLGYRLHKNTYYHPQRKAVFLGDFINKGPESDEVLRMIRQMVEQQSAYALVGNHELNLIGFFRTHAGGTYVREHLEKNILQLAPTFASFQGRDGDLQAYIRWLQSLPLFLELEGIRLVHAYWHSSSIALIRHKYPQNCLDDALLQDMWPGSEVRQAVDELMLGIRLPLPISAPQDSFKVRWWELGKTQRYTRLANRPDPALGDPAISTDMLPLKAYHYPEEAPPLFFGHYKLAESPHLPGKNYCCLDFNPDESPLLCAYRWEGELQLKEEHLLFV